MRTLIAALWFLAALPLAAAPAAAQGFLPFTIEGRAGLAIPVDDFASGAEAGYFAEATVKASPLAFATLYAGWTVAEFGIDSDAVVAGLDTKIHDSGLLLGGELSVPLAGLMTGVSPYLQVGALFNRAEVKVRGDGTNSLGMKSDRTTGLDLGAGVRVRLARHISLAPEVRYRRYDPDFAADPQIAYGGQLSYLAAGIGASFHF